MVFHYHRPLSATYGDNYRYGSSLYAPGMDDVEKNYRNTLSRTHLRSDRADLGMYTFAGSHLHGGRPAAEKIYAPKTKGSTTHNIYAPLNETPYDHHYYDHLRATSPVRRTRLTKSSPLMEEPEYTYTAPSYPTTKRIYDTEYKTLPTKMSTTDYDNDLKKTTKTTTTTTETWVPLTTYIYNTPYHTYYYKASPFSSYTYRMADDLYSYDFLDDYRRYSTKTTKTTTKNIDALDLSTTSKYEYTSQMEKCSNIKSQLEEVNRWVSEAESKMKNEISLSRNKIQTDLAELAMVVDDTAKYNDELYKAIRKQAKQISNLSSQYEDINRNIAGVAETLDKSRSRCQTLQSELHSVQSSLEMSSKRVY